MNVQLEILPIECAPKDGKIFIVTDGEGHARQMRFDLAFQKFFLLGGGMLEAVTDVPSLWIGWFRLPKIEEGLI